MDEILVRVKGINTPEKRNKDSNVKSIARAAKSITKNFLYERQLVLTNLEKGKFYRVLADFKVKGKMLSEHLIKSGVAVPYLGGKRKKQDWVKIYQSDACFNYRDENIPGYSISNGEQTISVASFKDPKRLTS